MNGTLVGVLVLVAIVGVVALAYVVAKSRATGVEPGTPDRVSDDVVSGLLSEMRKWQADAAYWKSTAERLQRELDGKQ